MILKQALTTSALFLFTLSSNGGNAALLDLRDAQEPARVVVAGPNLPTEPVTESGDEIKEEFHQTYPINANGRVSIENINGEVRIKVWDRAAVQVDAVKRAYKKERLAEATIEVNASPETVRIRTEYPDQNQNYRSDERKYDNPAIVDYVLTIPRKGTVDSAELINGSLTIEGVEGNVKASSINGHLTASGLMGEAKLSTINGPLEAVFSHLEESKGIYLQSVNGPLTLTIPSDSNASVRASTVHGGITNDFGLSVRHGEYVGHDLDGQIGNGGARIKLGNVNGPIKINHAQDGRTLNPATSRIVDRDSVDRDVSVAVAVDVARDAASATAAMSADAAARAKEVNAARIAREVQRETQRQVDVNLREAQREVARAQAEVQRENLRVAREQIRIVRGRGYGSGSGSGSGSRFNMQETKSFTVNGTPSVNIGTFDGAITIHGWDKSEVAYTATKRANDEDELKNISIGVDQQGSSVSIIAKSPESNGSVQFDVYVPRRATLHVSSGDGHLNLEGVSGDITLRTGDGSIEVTNGGGQFQINTGDGRIHVASFEGQLDARTGDGSISLDGNFKALSARTGDGTISLSVPNGSNFIVETNSQNEINNENLTMTEDVAPSQRVKRWKIGTGGKVFVLHSGEGNIFLRSH